MGVPLLDLKSPQPHSALDLAVPLSVLYGCNTIPIGGFINVDAQLRVGANGDNEKTYSVLLQLAKDSFNLHISVIDDDKKIFKNGKKHYCIVGGKSPSDEVDNVDEENDNESEHEEIAVDEETPDTQTIQEDNVPTESLDESLGKETISEDMMIEEAKGSNAVVILDRLDDVLIAQTTKKTRGRPRKDAGAVVEEPVVAVLNEDTSRRFPARRNRMSRLIGMKDEYEVQASRKIKKEKGETPKRKVQEKVTKVVKKAKIIKEEKEEITGKKHLPLPPVISIDGQVYITKSVTGKEGEQHATVLEDELVVDDGTELGDVVKSGTCKEEVEHAIVLAEELVVEDSTELVAVAPVESDVSQELVATGEVSQEDASFIEDLLHGTFANEMDAMDENLVVDVDPATDGPVTMEEGVTLREDLLEGTEPVQLVDEENEAGDIELFSDENMKPSEAAEAEDVSATAVLKKQKPRSKKKSLKIEKTDEGYFLQVSGQLYYMNGRQKSTTNEKVVEEDESVYPFTIAGVEVPKGFKQKSFTIEQRKEISKALEPEKLQINICILCKLLYTQKTQTHIKLMHSDCNLPRNNLKCNQLHDRVQDIITRFSESGTQLHIACPMCENDFSSFEYLEHLTSTHASQLESNDLLHNEIICDMIKNHVRHEWVESPHMAKLRKAVGSHTSMCSLCHKVQAKRSLYYHVNIYCGVNVLRGDHFTCKECMHISVNKDEFTQHHEKFHSKKRYICQFCGAVFERKQMYYQHLRLKHKHGKTIPKEAIQCPVEGCKYKTYHDKRMKVHHERKHSKEKPHLCEHCGQSFACKSYLISHYLQIHPDLKKYFCRRCKRGFRVHEAYKRHITCCFDLADPTSQIEFKAADAEPLKPEEFKDLIPAPLPSLAVASVIKDDPEVPIQAEQQEFMFILQDESGAESVIQKWETNENDQLPEGVILAPDPNQQPLEVMPEQNYIQETMIVDSGGLDSGQTIGIDSQELIKLCGNELGEFPVGTEILVYMDNSKEGEPKYHVVQENI